MSGSIYELVKKKEEQNTEKRIQENQERLNKLTFKMFDWFETEGMTVQDAVVVMKIVQQTFQAIMDEKMRPVTLDWQSKSVKDFYASRENKDASSS